jgi:MoaA/NifB/PqqE/SkfB family radical SAM enzyme
LRNIKVHNIRIGFATNSSSTHSIVYFNKDDNLINHRDNQEDFGWEYFALVEKSSKQEYMFDLLKDMFETKVPTNLINSLLMDWLELTPDQLSKFKSEGGTVDHQSRFGFPLNWDGTFIDTEFAKDFLGEVLNNPKIAILGGNDNGGGLEDHPNILELNDPSEYHVIDTDSLSNQFISRKDKKYNYFTMFNRSTGLKIRYSISNHIPPHHNSITPHDSFYSNTDVYSSHSSKIVKAFFPELVDIKITDYCPYGCTYCYQNSTTSGVHATLDDIKNIADALRENHVFEVALGGGEPTLHPNFIEILEIFKDRKIIANFTTRNLNWLKSNKEFLINDFKGAFAISVDSVASTIKYRDFIKSLRDDIRKANGTRYWYRTRGEIANFQVVVGSCPEEEFKQMLKLICNIGVPWASEMESDDNYHLQSGLTLLGYKLTGRGNEFKHYSYNWFNILQELKINNIGIDTVLAKDIDRRKEISKTLYETEEGKFSMYIDAVARKYGPSSFCEESEMIHYTESELKDTKAFLDKLESDFAKF